MRTNSPRPDLARLLVQFVALLDELFKLSGLRRDTIGCSLLVRAARGSCRLFDELANIVAQNRDAVVKFGS